MRRFVDAQLLGPAAALAIIIAIASLTTDRFLDFGNLSNLSLQVCIIALVAIGSTMVIITAGIDLSSGSMVALLTMLLAEFVKNFGLPLPLAILAVLFCGLMLGVFNGVLTAYLRIPSFITTLAGLISFRGLALLFNNGSPSFSIHPMLEKLFYGSFIGIPLPFYYLILFYAAAAILMKDTRIGREIYAVGGNPSAASLSGINVKRIQTFAFAMAGLMTAVGAVLMSARLNSGSPNYGQALELQAIAAGVVGGASLAGGRGNILSTLIGSLTIVVVQNALNLNAVPTSVQNIVLGAIILIAVGIDMWRGELSGKIGSLFTISSRKNQSLNGQSRPTLSKNS
ncbi:ABC transporter permease [uncultured Cohaesibacter sp.]|uniref:ABC transporter permease n=1 Tax=uncultured Cohaesibacter sp. TaxID=1002546 RepID=UPI0029C8A123|nr:ABC transporter permease [uncultured Cohaesibacter sp.]